ncbi:MAG: Rossmann-like and DUF2520 domain-containing protein [Candidatus Aminicenantia bacterium]
MWSLEKFRKNISIIGSGRAGTSLAFNLKRKGWRILYLYDISKSSACESKEIIGEGEIEEIDIAINKGYFFVLSVPDGKIENLSKEISEKNIDLKNKIFIHISGSLSFKALNSLKERGAKIGSLHPVFPFPSKETIIPVGIYFCWEGEEDAYKKAFEIVKDLKGKIIKIDKEKDLYHLGCSIASNLISILFLMGVEKVREAGVKEEDAKQLLFKLSVESIKSVIDKGWEGITGPATRGDVETIHSHLRNLNQREKRIYKEILIHYLEKMPSKEIIDLFKKERS